MMEHSGDDRTRVLIVGGGNGGANLLRRFHGNQMIDIRGVVDLNPEAEGMVLARKLGVATYGDLKNPLSREPIDLVIEATGVRKVLDAIRANVSEKTEVLTSNVAHFFFNVLNETCEDINREVSSDINRIQTKITRNTKKINEILKSIEKLTMSLKILSLNASVEASRAGEAGKGFGVVANAVGETADNTEALAGRIKLMNEDIYEMSNDIDKALKKLDQN